MPNFYSTKEEAPGICGSAEFQQNTEYTVDDIAKIISIRNSISKGNISVSRLVDYLSEECKKVAEASREALFAKVPMASLQERIADDSPIPPYSEKIPSWIWEACSDWNTNGDFVDICIEKLLALKSYERRLLFLSRLAAFQGASRLIKKRLAEKGLKDLQADFSHQVKSLRKEQFPLQLGLSPTLECQLNCDYCISSGIEPLNRNEMPFKEALKIIEWAHGCGVSRIGLSGGEPTLYSGFQRLLKEIKNAGMDFFLATNGLFSSSLASKLINYSPLCISMHLTEQVIKNETLKSVFINNGAYLTENKVNTVLRVNFSSPDTNLIEFFDIAERTGIKEIRTAVPIPNFQRKNFYIERDELSQYGNILNEFVSLGRDRNIQTALAKPFFPCKMPKEAAMTFFANSSMSVSCPVHINGFSNNLVVLPHGRAIPCLGFSRPLRHRIIKYKSISEVAADYKSDIKLLMHKPLLAECSNCPLNIGIRCIGACLSYSAGPESHLIDYGTAGEV